MKVGEIYNCIIMQVHPNKRFSYRNYWLKNTWAYKYIIIILTTQSNIRRWRSKKS
jgi:hypothetical protein